MPVRTATTVAANHDDVFAYLSAGSIHGFAVGEVDAAASVVVLKSGPSAFSWGEKIELTVTEAPDGRTTVSFRGATVHPFNPTADVKGTVGRILAALRDRFGPLE